MANMKLPSGIAGLLQLLVDMGDGTYAVRMASTSVSSAGVENTALPAGRATSTASVPTTSSSDVGTDRSITATTTTAVLMAANATRGKFFVKNDTAIDVWINLGAAAVAAAGSGNLKVAANGGYYELTGYSGAVNIIAASTTAAVTAREI